jgi:hypothetical protein
LLVLLYIVLAQQGVRQAPPAKTVLHMNGGGTIEIEGAAR